MKNFYKEENLVRVQLYENYHAFLHSTLTSKTSINTTNNNDDDDHNGITMVLGVRCLNLYSTRRTLAEMTKRSTLLESHTNQSVTYI
jgi:hypothetical protein